MKQCKSCDKKKLAYFMHMDSGLCEKCYSEHRDLHFQHRCIFNHQMSYGSREDDLYEVQMTSGRVGIYAREIKDSVNYSGTGQHDYHFTFLKYKGLTDGTR